MLRHLMFLLALSSAPAFACVSNPETLELSGASFSAATNMQLYTNCGASLKLSLVSDDKARDERSQKYISEMDAWEKKNPRPRGYGPEYEAYSERRKAIANELNNKFPNITPKLDLTISVNERRICFGRDRSHCGLTKNQAITDENGKTIAILDMNATRAILFSVDEKGQKDATKPAIVIRPKDLQSAAILSYDKRKMVGNADIDGEICTRGSNPGQGKLPLRGKSYSSEGGGCHSGLADSEFGKQLPAALSPYADAAQGFQ